MNKNTLNALLLSCEPQILSKAEKCLQRNTSISVKCFPDEQGYCFEGFIMERGNRIWMPYVVLNMLSAKDFEIIGISYDVALF